MRNNSHYAVRQLCFSALMAAIAVIILVLGSLIPGWSLATTVICGFFVLAEVCEGGFGWGLGVYAVAALLSLLFTTDKSNALLFAVFFGYYPAVKSLIERIRKMLPEWIIKFVILNAAFSAVLFLCGGIVKLEFKYEFLNLKPVLYVCVNILFVIYDIALSKLAGFYMQKIHPLLRRK